MPPAAAGDPNWGAEPGLPVPPGATRIAFYAAALDGPVAVTFGAGLATEAFVVRPKAVTLTPSWERIEVALPVTGHGGSVLGGFSWAITDTTRPARFFLDGIVWE